jgi:hypothetical protein
MHGARSGQRGCSAKARWEHITDIGLGIAFRPLRPYGWLGFMQSRARNMRTPDSLSYEALMT